MDDYKELIERLRGVVNVHTHPDTYAALNDAASAIFLLAADLDRKNEALRWVSQEARGRLPQWFSSCISDEGKGWLNPEEADVLRFALARAQEEIEGLRAELASVLSDWNAIVKASGSPTNGGAIGHVEGLRRDAERYRWLRKAREHWDILRRDDEDSCWADLHGNDLDAAIDSAMGAQK